MKTASAAQKFALLVALAFLVAGVAGFVPGITTNAPDIPFSGHESESKLLGIFEVTILHNLVHVAFGLAGLFLARFAARLYLVGGGALYLLVFLYGLLVDHESWANFIGFDEADNYLHLGAGVAMVVGGAVLSPKKRG